MSHLGMSGLAGQLVEEMGVSVKPSLHVSTASAGSPPADGFGWAGVLAAASRFGPQSNRCFMLAPPPGHGGEGSHERAAS
mmetsp:Transcript_32518/g.89721  ORF Transcript_32518/g.89721 Transcript_32518/m.89721 type:complete len:80 (-) Transcript_32518:8-247(-)